MGAAADSLGWHTESDAARASAGRGSGEMSVSSASASMPARQRSPAASGSQAEGRLLAAVESGALDKAILALEVRRLRLQWERLPERVVLLRHGESEGNVNHVLYTNKGDSLLELTPRGLTQAKEAGQRVRDIVGTKPIFVCLSPFERTQQTLLGMYSGGFPEEQVGAVHVEVQIREQEFGNFQEIGLNAKVRAEEKRVGRFYYRRPNAESSADVLDRVSQFWDKLLSDGNDALLLGRSVDYGTCLVVTHGLTIRLLLMRILNWSVETFETVWNVGNCNHFTLRKDINARCYRLCDYESYPPRRPWATRPVWVVLRSLKASEETERKLERLEKFSQSAEGQDLINTVHCEAEGGNPGASWTELDRAIDELRGKRLRERSRCYTVVDYLGIPMPRTMQTAEVLSKLVAGHDIRGTPDDILAKAQAPEMEGGPLDLSEVEFIDWWGDLLSYRGKMLRTAVSDVAEVAAGRAECAPAQGRGFLQAKGKEDVAQTPARYVRSISKFRENF